MANRDDIKKIMAYMGMCFPNYHPILEGEINAVDVLLDLLGDMDIEMLQAALKACCTEPGRAFAPSAGEIRGAASDLHARVAGLPTAAEAWGAVMDSFRRTSFDKPELLEHPLLKEAIRCMGGLEVIGMSENNMADRAHFLKIFEQLRERAIQETLELPAITEYIESKRLIDGQMKALVARMHRLPVLIEDSSHDNEKRPSI
ncbi:MAG TPA: replicative helicase loader/inhibitor [Anaerolineales bacterium]